MNRLLFPAALFAFSLCLPSLAQKNPRPLPEDFKSLEALVALSMKALAEEGDAESQYNLGEMYLNGHGVAQDDKEAIKWYRKAAGRNHPQAQYTLGDMYRNGHGVAQDDKEAAKWYREAAEQNFPQALHNLGAMYELGLGVAKDEQEAVKWYRRAAEKGAAFAQFRLGMLHYAGTGVAQKDIVTACAWLIIAATNGLLPTNTFHGSFPKKLTPEQIVKAEALAKDMMGKNPNLIQRKN